jgi:hypothetical protein
MSIISGIFIPIIIYFSAAGGSANYVSGAQWALLAANPMLDRHPVARCHQIPRNFSLCHGMQVVEKREIQF